MDLPEEVRANVPKWRRMGYVPHCVSMKDSRGNSHVIVFRTLTKKEFEELGESVQPPETAPLGPLYTDQYQELIETALLWPRVIPDCLPASIDRLLAEAIVEASAWLSTDRLVIGLQEARQAASSLEGFLHSRICAAFPNHTLKQIRDLRFEEMMELVAMSETITGMPVDLQPWLDPQGYEKRMISSQRQQRREVTELQNGLQTSDTRLMRDPAMRRKLMEVARSSRENLNSREKGFDLTESMNDQIQGLSRV